MPEAFLILQKSPAGGPAGEKLQKLIKKQLKTL